MNLPISQQPDVAPAARLAVVLALSVGAVGAHGLTRAAEAGIEVSPAQGMLLVATGGEAPSPLPLVGTSVVAEITGTVARARVRQTFSNPYPDPIEAVYVFPLPEDAAVSEMLIRVEDRTIRGLVKRREEARSIYERARSEGHTAALLDQERPNIFTQSVANIAAHSEVVVDIAYDVELTLEDGRYEFAFPMTVGPRYIPGTPDGRPPTGDGTAPDTDRVPDASRVTPPVVKPGFRSGRDIDIKVTIDAGAKISELNSPTHEITIDRNGPAAPDGPVHVGLARADEIPNRDFVLRYRMADREPVVAVLAHRSEDSGYFAVQFEPPAAVTDGMVSAKEIFFVVDTSGSMRGAPLAMVKSAMSHAISRLNPGDTFQIIRFSSSVSQLSREPLAVTPANIDRGLAYVRSLSGSGGTEMLSGMRAALDEAGSGDRLRIVCFMTDGFIGNDDEILAEIDKRLGDRTRLFSFGVGSSVNRYLLERMGQVGRGTVAYMHHSEPPQPQIDRFFERIRSPVLTDIELDWNGLQVADVSPRRLPDLFAGQPLRLVGRFRGHERRELTVRGRLGGRRVEYRIPVDFSVSGSEHAVLVQLWARAQIRDVSIAALSRNADAVEAAERQITELGLRHQLVTKYTSFVAVDEKIIEGDGQLKTIQIPVEMPEGTSYESVFGDEDEEYDRDYAPGTTQADETLALRARPDGSWRFGVGFGLGANLLSEPGTSPLVGSLELRLDRIVGGDLALGGAVGVLLPAGGELDLIVNPYLQAAYIGLLRQYLHLVAGVGPSLVSGGSVGLALMAAIELGTPIPAAGVQIRYDHIVLGDQRDIGNLTFGIELTF